MRKIIQLTLLPFIWLIGKLNGRCDEYLKVHSQCMDGRACPIEEKIKQRFHLLFCSSCRKWTKQVNDISEAVKTPILEKEAALNEAAKNRICEKIRKQLEEDKGD